MLSKDIGYAELIWKSDHAVRACYSAQCTRDTEMHWLGGDGVRDLIRSNEPGAARDDNPVHDKILNRKPALLVFLAIFLSLTRKVLT
jgi:hypothetical protein